MNYSERLYPIFISWLKEDGLKSNTIDSYLNLKKGDDWGGYLITLNNLMSEYLLKNYGIDLSCSMLEILSYLFSRKNPYDKHSLRCLHVVRNIKNGLDIKSKYRSNLYSALEKYIIFLKEGKFDRCDGNPKITLIFKKIYENIGITMTEEISNSELRKKFKESLRTQDRVTSDRSGKIIEIFSTRSLHKIGKITSQKNNKFFQWVENDIESILDIVVKFDSSLPIERINLKDIERIVISNGMASVITKSGLSGVLMTQMSNSTNYKKMNVITEENISLDHKVPMKRAFNEYIDDYPGLLEFSNRLCDIANENKLTKDLARRKIHEYFDENFSSDLVEQIFEKDLPLLSTRIEKYELMQNSENSSKNAR